jgi:HPt (histidine-containing phosphotransfer) domain-containing protein
VAAFAHWLKGAGGTVGFEEFTEPARQLEQLANEEGDESEMAEAWKQIHELGDRLKLTGDALRASSSDGAGADRPASAIDTPAPAEITDIPAKPLISRFAETPGLPPIIHMFIEKLDESMDQMEQAYKQGDWEQLALLAHWLKGAGGTVGFDDFTVPAKELEESAKAGQADQVGAMLDQVKGLKNAIVPPELEGNHPVETVSAPDSEHRVRFG